MSTRAYVKQQRLPYRGEPTKRVRIDIRPTSFMTLSEQKMGDPQRVIGRKKKQTRNPWTEEDIKTVVELRRQGLSLSQIAAKVNRSKGNVHRKLQERGDV